MVVATCKSTKYTLIAARVISVAAAYAPSVCSLSMQHLKHNSPPVYDTWQLVLTFAVSCFLGLVSFNLLALTSLQQTTHQASGQLPTSADGRHARTERNCQAVPCVYNHHLCAGHAIAAAAIASTRHGVPFKQADHALQIVFESRVCGSPAVDG
jgi:zinc transporter ZupT